MAEELLLYTNPMSRGRIARWMLEETGVPYRREILGYGGMMKSDDFLRINPMGKVPAIVHGGHVVTECAAICAYLADAFPEAGLAPPPAERAAYYRWMFFAAGPLEAAVVNRALRVEVPVEQRRMVGYGSYEQVLDTLEAALSASDYVAGARFTAADVYVGAHVSWGLAFKSIESRPAFEAYAARIVDRSAARRARQLDDADAAALQSEG